MFQKKKEPVKPVEENPEPQKIGEVEEPTDTVEESAPAENAPSENAPVEEKIPEESVKEWKERVAAAIMNQEERVRRIEHHLRLDFD